ncbi:34025_t:CDS:1, partial [Racocetra persica]
VSSSCNCSLILSGQTETIISKKAISEGLDLGLDLSLQKMIE